MAKRGDKYGKWTIVELLDRGGQGGVYRASGGEASPEVAIKIVNAKRVKKRNRFLQEINAQKQLTADAAANVMPLLDSNLEELEDGGVTGYLVMPLAHSSLESALETTKSRIELTLEIFAGILAGVDAAHKAGIIHRDLKPANILFLDSTLRQPLIADFGICFLKETADTERLTEEGETVGAKYFMAPEQERGGVVAVTAAADVYALGKLLHHMLTGRNIYREEIDDAFRPAELSADPRYGLILDRIISKTVVHNPESRLSLDELIAAVRTIRGADEPPSPTAEREVPVTPASPAPGSSALLVQAEYDRFLNVVGQTASPAYLNTLDAMRRDLQLKWGRLADTIKDAPDQAPEAAQQLIESQPRPLALALALGRSNSASLFPGFQHFLEATLREDEPRSGYPAVFSVPHVLGGFLYMVAATQALVYESWDVLKLLLSEKLEWFYRSERPLYSFAFAVPYFFHPEALGREASKTHDLYRKLLSDDSLRDILTLSGDQLVNKYLQAQMLMSLRIAQESEKGNQLRIWPDFGRFYDFRVRPLFDRAHGIPAYGNGIGYAFDETRSEFLGRVNARLFFIRNRFWSGSSFFWESLTEWSPRE